MNEEMLKSLVNLIDESLAEIEELKKSDRFSASEIKLDGPGEGIAGKDSNGNIGKADDEDKKDEDKKDDEDKKEEDMDKGEGVNSPADPNAGNHQVVKADDEKDEKKDEDKKEEGEDKKDKDADEKMEKSLKDANALLKSYVDGRLSPIESKLEAIMGLVKEVANSPVPSKGTSYKNVAPLKKSAGEVEPLNKSAVVEKLFELKKSGTPVSTVDIASAELAEPADLAKIAQKYNLK